MNHPSSQPLRSLDDPPLGILLSLFMIHRNPLNIQAMFDHPHTPPDRLVLEAGYLPGAIQRRIRSLLNNHLPDPAPRITGGIHQDDVPILSKKIAFLKREEGIGRLLDLSWPPRRRYLVHHFRVD